MGLFKIGIDDVSKSQFLQENQIIEWNNINNDYLFKKISNLNLVNNLIFKVNTGQMLVLYYNGSVIDITMESGIYVYKEDCPLFCDECRDSLFLKKLYLGFTGINFNENSNCAFFINLNEIGNNKFGTISPLPFYDWKYTSINKMTNKNEPLKIFIKSYGTYNFRIFDLVAFMSRIINYTDEYKVSDLRENLRLDIIDLFQKLLNELCSSNLKISYENIVNYNNEFKNIIDNKSLDSTINDYGIKITNFNVLSVSLDEESKNIILKFDGKNN